MIKHVFFTIKIFIVFTILIGINGCKDSEIEPKTKTIGISTFVAHPVLDSIRDGFLSEMNSLGYDNKNTKILILNANGDGKEAAFIADQLLNAKADVLVSFSTPATKPLYEKNNGKLPLVFSFVSYPQSIGITDESPNVTGLSDDVDFERLIDFAKIVDPNLIRIGMVYSDEPNAITSYTKIKTIVDAKGMQLISQSVSREDEVRGAIEALIKLPENSRPQAVIVAADGVVTNRIDVVTDIANSIKIPVYAVDESSVSKGAFAGLSINYRDFGKETAQVVNQVLRGESASNIKIKKFFAQDILVNERTQQHLGLSSLNVPPEYAFKLVK